MSLFDNLNILKHILDASRQRPKRRVCFPCLNYTLRSNALFIRHDTNTLPAVSGPFAKRNFFLAAVCPKFTTVILRICDVASVLMYSTHSLIN